MSLSNAPSEKYRGGIITESSQRKIGFEINSIGNLLKRQRPENPQMDDRITRMQMWIIGYIRSRGDSSDVFQGELEHKFNMTRATTSSILKRMERDGLITRQTVSHDARCKKILLTDEAIHRGDEVRHHLDETERLMSQNISQEDLDVFFSVIDKIKSNLKQGL